MVHSFCLYGTGLLPITPGQDRPAVPRGEPRYKIPGIVIAAGLLIGLIVTAILVQVFVLRPVPLPAAANTSALTLPATTTPGPVMNITGAPLYLTHTPATRNSRELPVISTSLLETLVHDRVNAARQEHGVPVLGTDTTLAALARAHSTDMAAKGYFGHLNLQEWDATARGAAAGYTCHKEYETYYTSIIAENLYATWRYDDVRIVNGSATFFDGNSEEAIAEETVDAWMNSPDHRENILDPHLLREGIGVAIADYDLIFITEDLC
jgi:uncharacterized protein YkwD